jgi:hypothetical protein
MIGNVGLVYHLNQQNEIFIGGYMFRILLVAIIFAFGFSWLISRCSGIHVKTPDENTARKTAQEQLLPYCAKEFLDCSNLTLKHTVSDGEGWFVMYIENNLKDGVYFYVPKEGKLEITPFGKFNKTISDK